MNAVFVQVPAKRFETARGRVEVDVYAIDPATNPPSVYLCECKRWSTSVPQGEVQTFRTVVADSGANHGLFISAKGFQQGAHEVVQHTNVHLSSWQEFQELFLERWCERYWVPTFRTGADRLAGYVDPPISDASLRHAEGKPLEPEEAVGLMALKMWSAPFATDLAYLMQKPAPPLNPAIWELRDSFKAYLPENIRHAQYLRDLLQLLLQVAKDWARRTRPVGGNIPKTK